MFESKEFIVESIEGEYANLRRIDVENGALVLVALFLLPMETDIGVKIKYENFEYSAM